MAKAAPMGLFELIGEVEKPEEYGWLKTVDYQLATLDEARAYVAEAVAARTPVSCDWETNSLNHYDGRLRIAGLGLSARHGTARYIPICHLKGAELNQPLAGVKLFLQELDAAGVPTVWHHYQYDGEVCFFKLDWEPEHWEDTQLALWLEDSNQKQYGLKYSAMRLLGVKMLEFAATVGAGTFDQLHPEDVRQYVCGDADMTRRLWMLPKVREAVAAQRFIYDLEKLVVPCIREGMRHGVYLDVGRLRQFQQEIGARERKPKKKADPFLPATGQIKALQEEIYALAGGPFDLNSGPVLGQKLVEMGVPITERTPKTGAVQTGEDVLVKYQDQYPICERIVRYKKLETQCRNYVEKLILAVDRFGPLARFAFNPQGAPTGRMSAGGEGKEIEETLAKGIMPVNVQSLPDPEKEDYLPNLRACIIANDPRTDSDDFVLVAIDYSQIEMRIAGNLSREPAWIKTYSDPEGDIHLTNARLAYANPKMTKDDPLRKKGKTLGFATLYGGSEYTVAQKAGIEVKAAKVLMDNFFAGAPALKAWIESVQAYAMSHRLVKTYFGRVRRLEEFFNDETLAHIKENRATVERGKREAVNDPVQGTAADIFKIACHKVRRMLREKGWQDDFVPVLWIHDELVAVARRSRLKEVLPWVVAAMEFKVGVWPIALKVDVEVGWDWGTMQPVDQWWTSATEKPQYSRPPTVESGDGNREQEADRVATTTELVVTDWVPAAARV